MAEEDSSLSAQGDPGEIAKSFGNGEFIATTKCYAVARRRECDCRLVLQVPRESREKMRGLCVLSGERAADHFEDAGREPPPTRLPNAVLHGVDGVPPGFRSSHVDAGMKPRRGVSEIVPSPFSLILSLTRFESWHENLPGQFFTGHKRANQQAA